MKKKTKQLFILNLKYPFESVHTLLFNSDYIKKIFDNSEYQIKFFIGSDWSIKNSGFSFYGPNGYNSVFELLSITENDFIRESNFSTIQINGERLNIELITQFSLINNTCDNTSIIEIRFNYQFDEDLIILEIFWKRKNSKNNIKPIIYYQKKL